VAYAGLGDLVTAQNYLHKAVRASPCNANSIINLTNTYLSQNDIDAAFEVLAQYLSEFDAD
jgi:predicted Zn-dependent protease